MLNILEINRVGTYLLLSPNFKKGSEISYKKFCQNFWPTSEDKKESEEIPNNFSMDQWDQLLKRDKIVKEIRPEDSILDHLQ